ncbi:MAG: phosphatidylglycerophosphatase A [Methanocellales archaeon]
MNDINGMNDINALLWKYGVTLESMGESAVALYEPKGELDEESKLEIQKRFQREVEKQLLDPNVYLLIDAAIYLDEKHKLSDSEKRTGPAFILADELIGMVIAEFIGGKKALFNFIRYDQVKPGILSKLNVFLDDAIAGLIAGCMTKIFENSLKKL